MSNIYFEISEIILIVIENKIIKLVFVMHKYRIVELTLSQSKT